MNYWKLRILKLLKERGLNELLHPWATVLTKIVFRVFLATSGTLGGAKKA
jgi:hypothetical protein